MSKKWRVVRRPLLLFALAAAACGRPLPPELAGPERGQASLTDLDILTIARILQLEDQRAYDSAAFDRFAADASAEVRRRAVAAAGRIGDTTAVPLLLRMLDDDPEPGVRADAAFALGELGDTSEAVVVGLRQAAPPSWAPVRPAETAVVVEVVGAFGKLGTDRARDLISDVLLRLYPPQNELARRIAAEALLAFWRFRQRPARVTTVVPFLSSGDAELRWRAAYALMRMGGGEGLRYLLPAMSDDDYRVRAQAARALSASRADSAGVRAQALAALDSALSDEHPHVRINALGALGSYGDEAPVATIARRLRDPVPNVAVAAATALGRVGAMAHDSLAAISVDAAVPLAVRTAAAAALAGPAPDLVWPGVEAWAAGDDTARYAAARTLAASGWARAGDALRRLAGDADRRVAVAALQGMGQVARDTTLAPAVRDELRTLLLEAARSPESARSAAALEAASPLLRAADRDALFEIYAAAGADSGALATAVAAVEALVELARADAAIAPAFFRRFPAPADRWIRRSVGTSLGTGWGETPPAVAGEGIEFYRRVATDYVARILAGTDRPQVEIETAGGTIVVELLAAEAPLTVHNFITLAERGYFDGGVWHRVVPNFVLQDGAPGGHASGGPGWSIRDEINRVRYGRGAMGMALSGPDTGGSQWFITHSPQPHLDGGYTVFGRVVAGMEVADAVLQGDPIEAIRVRR